MSHHHKAAKMAPHSTNVLVGRHVDVVRDPDEADHTWPIRPIKGPEQGKVMAQYITDFFQVNKPSGKNKKVALICGPAVRHVDTTGLILKYSNVPWLTFKRTGAPFKVLSHANELDLGYHAARSEEDLLKKFKIHDLRVKKFKRTFVMMAIKTGLIDTEDKMLMREFMDNVDEFEFPQMLQELGKNFEMAKKSFGTYFVNRPGGDKPFHSSLHQRIVLDQIDEIKENYNVNDVVLITSGAASKLFYLEATQNSALLYKKLPLLPPSGIELYRSRPDLPKQYDYFGHVHNPVEEIYEVKNFTKQPMHPFMESYPHFFEKFPELRQKFPGWNPG
jgi:hypothetical protein